MLYQLKVAKGPVNRLYEEKEKIIEREIELLKSFLNEIKPHAAIEYINEQECVMIYEFQDSDNDLIGDEVFLSPDFEVVYQVYDEYAYKGFVPSAEVINGYRSEEHTSELQSRGHLVCRLLLEKKKDVGCITSPPVVGPSTGCNGAHSPP